MPEVVDDINSLNGDSITDNGKGVSLNATIQGLPKETFLDFFTKELISGQHTRLWNYIPDFIAERPVTAQGFLTAKARQKQDYGKVTARLMLYTLMVIASAVISVITLQNTVIESEEILYE